MLTIISFASSESWTLLPFFFGVKGVQHIFSFYIVHIGGLLMSCTATAADFVLQQC